LEYLAAERRVAVADSVQIIRREVRKLANAAAPMIELRESCKTDGGRLTPAGRSLIEWARNTGSISQATTARILDVTAAAVSRHWNS
jgi:methionine synthase II (cobalamin-independent)